MACGDIINENEICLLKHLPAKFSISDLVPVLQSQADQKTVDEKIGSSQIMTRARRGGTVGGKTSVVSGKNNLYSKQ